MGEAGADAVPASAACRSSAAGEPLRSRGSRAPPPAIQPQVKHKTPGITRFPPNLNRPIRMSVRRCWLRAMLCMTHHVRRNCWSIRTCPGNCRLPPGFVSTIRLNWPKIPDTLTAGVLCVLTADLLLPSCCFPLLDRPAP